MSRLSFLVYFGGLNVPKTLNDKPCQAVLYDVFSNCA